MSVRVLIVEDDAFARATLLTSIRHHEFDARAADTPSAAMAEFAAFSPAVVVLDLHLGDGPTGLDVAKGMRRLRSDVGLVLLTSFTDPRLLGTSRSELPDGMLHLVKQGLTDTQLLASAIEAAAGLASGSAPPPPAVPLTESQIDTLRLLAAGLSNSEIARLRVVTAAAVEKSIARTAKALSIPVTDDINQRVALARAYYRMIGRGT